MTTIAGNRIAKGERRCFPGTVFTVLVPSERTGNNIFIAELECVPGHEPARHFHHFEDEIFMIREGTVSFFPGDSIVQAGPGDTVLLSKNIPHHFLITSEKLVATLITTPGNIEYLFRHLSVPCTDNDSEAGETGSEKPIHDYTELMDHYGIYYV